MDAEKRLEYWNGQSNDTLKLEYLKAKTRWREKRAQQAAEPDEYWKAKLQIEIDQEAAMMQTIDDVWFFRYQLHIPREDADDE